MKGKTKLIISITIAVLIIGVPLALVSSPALRRYQKSNKETYKKLRKKKKKGEDVSEEWKELMDAQKFVGDVYRITFRKEKAIKAYRKYHKWFIDSWEKDQFLTVKFQLARLHEEIARDNVEKRQEYRRRAACHFLWIKKWYDPEKDHVTRAKKALSMRLSDYAKNCQQYGVR